MPLSKMGAQQVERSKLGAKPLKITKVEPVITSSPMVDGPLSEAVQMPPLGTMTDQVGLRNRLNHNFPSRSKGHSLTTLVKITTDQGIIGWGEAHAPLAPAVHAKVVTDLFAPIILGEDARNIGPIWEKLYS
ncbi:MAG: hypothetical protein F7B06_08740, partial [Opitutae bacterium]|nr:hypothetical protein [Opitutae bacterium]